MVVGVEAVVTGADTFCGPSGSVGGLTWEFTAEGLGVLCVAATVVPRGT